MESSPESMRGASAEIFVPVTSEAMAVSSSSRAFCERALLLAFAGYVDLGTFRGISDLARDFLSASGDFASPTVTKSISRKLVLESSCVAFCSRDLENDTTCEDLFLPCCSRYKASHLFILLCRECLRLARHTFESRYPLSRDLEQSNSFLAFVVYGFKPNTYCGLPNGTRVWLEARWSKTTSTPDSPKLI